MNHPLDLDFTQATLDPNLQWHCEPAQFELGPPIRCLRLHTDAETDFWQRTHYGFQADNGHFLFADWTQDFVLRTGVRFVPRHQYDQAGLMVRLSSECWLKASIEHEPGRADRLGAVVTNGGYSDWSTQDVQNVREVQLQVEREGGDYTVSWSQDGTSWSQMRVAHLHEDDGSRTIHCGIYACSPKGEGFAPDFDLLRITPRT